jgi:hypothetical protein
MRVMPRRVHGIIDYLMGIALILAPNLFGFEDVGGAAVTIPRVLGVGMIVMALITDYEMGIVKILPFSAHLAIDFLAAILLIASPFLFGFSDNPANVWVPHVVAGIAEFLVALLTQRQDWETAQDTSRDVSDVRY